MQFLTHSHNQKALLLQVRKRSLSWQSTQLRGTEVDWGASASRASSWRDSNHGSTGTSASSGWTPLDLDVCLVNAFIKRKQICSCSCTKPFLFHSLFHFQMEEHCKTDCSLCRTQEAAHAILVSFCTLVLLTWSLMFIHLQRVLV